MKTIKERFMEKIRINPDTGCWEWQSSLRKGYGLFFKEGRAQSAHRVSFEIHNGGIPEGCVVLHKCDNRKCVNPAHLDVGTQHDNVLDCISKRRRADFYGANNGQARLNEGDVKFIRESNLSSRKLGEIFGVSKTQILRIRNYSCWRKTS